MRSALADDAATSPVIGIILMVAITVVLGATVFLFATQFSDRVAENDIAPRIGFIKQSGDLVVQKAEGDADWSEIQVDAPAPPSPPGPCPPASASKGAAAT